MGASDPESQVALPIESVSANAPVVAARPILPVLANRLLESDALPRRPSRGDKKADSKPPHAKPRRTNFFDIL
jgi:hypothetical protein